MKSWEVKARGVSKSILKQFEGLYCKRLWTVKLIRLEKHLQCEKLLGLAKGTTKKRGNKKSDESITPIRYNVNHMYTGSFPCFPGQGPRNFYWSDDHAIPVYLLYIHFGMCGHIIMMICTELMFLIHAVLSTGTHSPSMRSNMHGPYTGDLHGMMWWMEAGGWKLVDGSGTQSIYYALYMFMTL